MCGAKSAAVFAPVTLKRRFVSSTRLPKRASGSMRLRLDAGRLQQSAQLAVAAAAGQAVAVCRARWTNDADDRDVGRRDAGDAGGRTERSRALPREFFARLERERRDARRNRNARGSRCARSCAAFSIADLLAADVAGALDFDRDPFADRRSRAADRSARATSSNDVSRTAQHVGDRRAGRRCARRRSHPAPARVRSARRCRARERVARALRMPPTLVVDRARSSRPIGVRRTSALSWRSITRCSAREVSMRYGSSTPRVDEIVDQHADVGIARGETQRLFARARRARR